MNDTQFPAARSSVNLVVRILLLALVLGVVLPTVLALLVRNHRTASMDDFFSDKYGVPVEYVEDLDGEFDLWRIDGEEERCDATGDNDAGTLECITVDEPGSPALPRR